MHEDTFVRNIFLQEQTTLHEDTFAQRFTFAQQQKNLTNKK